MSFSKKIVTTLVLLVLIFTIAVLLIFLKVGSEPSVLIGAFFAFVTGELWALATIKKSEGNDKEGEGADGSPPPEETEDEIND